MEVVCFASPKGGVGKTTITANLGVALHRLGWRVLAIDFDRQNSLRLHFELPNEEVRGIANEFDGGGDWSDLVLETPSGVFLLPFGAVSAAECLRMQAFVGERPGWVCGQLEPFFEYSDLIMLADMPPGPSCYDAALEPVAGFHIVALLADAMSLAILPRLQVGIARGGSRNVASSQIGYVLNQVDQRRQLNRDVLALTRDVLGERLYGTIHHDEAVPEAVACQLPVLDYAPDCVASQDLAELARRIDRNLKPG